MRQIKALNDDTNYLLRLTGLHAVQSLADAVAQNALQTQLLPLVLALARDPVPNVRFNVAKTLQALIPKMEASTVVSQVKPCLHSLSSDSDADVKYYATQALTAC